MNVCSRAYDVDIDKIHQNTKQMLCDSHSPGGSSHLWISIIVIHSVAPLVSTQNPGINDVQAC